MALGFGGYSSDAMKSTFAKILGISTLFAASLAAQQVSDYNFQRRAAGALLPITGGTVLASGSFDDAFFADLPIGFPFPFGGAAGQGAWVTKIGVSTNGWLRFSDQGAAANIYNPIASPDVARVAAPFAADLVSAAANSEIRVETIGIAPTRVCVVQWSAVKPLSAPAGSASMTFQARLSESTGKITFKYGSWSIGPGFTSATGSVGIKGNAASPVTDFDTVASTASQGTWASPIRPVSSPLSTMYVASGKLPSSGNEYIWEPDSFPIAAFQVTTTAAVLPAFTSVPQVITAQVATLPSGLPLSGTEVTIDASSVGSSSNYPMFDDGTWGDAVAGDGIYSTTLFLAATQPAYAVLPIRARKVGFTDGNASIAMFVYILPNDIPGAAYTVARGRNGPYSNTMALNANEPGFATACGPFVNPGWKDLFFLYTPSYTGTVSLSTCGGDAIDQPGEMSDSQLMVYTHNGTNYVAVACNEDGGVESGVCGFRGWQARILDLPTTANVPFMIRVSGYVGSQGYFYLDIGESNAIATNFGVGCGPSPLALSATAPRIGMTGTISVSGMPAGQIGSLLFSAPAAPLLNVGPCPYYIDLLGFTATLVNFNGDANGNWSITVPLPNDPALTTMQFHMQAMATPTVGFNAAQISSSNGVLLKFGI